MSGHDVTVEQRARIRLAAAHAVQTGASVVRGCTELVGADSVYRRHRLERLFRDAHVLIHHIVVSDRAVVGASMALHGLDPDASFV